MSIEAITFGKNLRPSTVEAINKINEIITAVNGMSDTESDVTTLKTQMSTANSNISSLQTSVGTNTTNITSLQTSVDTNTTNITSLQTDMSDVKETLYTPLTTNDSTN